MIGSFVSQPHAKGTESASFLATSAETVNGSRPRARDIGINVGILAPGPLNAITDVHGVLVGHVTLSSGTSVNTGATSIRPHGGNLYLERVPAGFYRGNGYGKFAGATQIVELGELESPIVLTNTLSVSKGIDAAIAWTLDQPGNERVRSVNAVVGETNDGYLSDIRGRHLTAPLIRKSIENARAGPVEEGSIGAAGVAYFLGGKGG